MAKKPDTSVPGLLIVDKDPGMTSHDVVSRVRRIARTRKVGHAGTLDPMATGVLVLGIGKATRLLTYLVGADKTYEATIRFGVDTSTEDAQGHVTCARGCTSMDSAVLAEAMAGLTGDIMQVPSKVSAIKVDGKRAHALVRAGEDFDLEARPITIHRFEVTSPLRPATHYVENMQHRQTGQGAGRAGTVDELCVGDVAGANNTDGVAHVAGANNTDGVAHIAGAHNTDGVAHVDGVRGIGNADPIEGEQLAGIPVIDVDVRVECSSGTYIRALARDLGQVLGTGAHLTALRRTRVGTFTVEDAHRLAELQEAAKAQQGAPSSPAEQTHDAAAPAQSSALNAAPQQFEAAPEQAAPQQFEAAPRQAAPEQAAPYLIGLTDATTTIFPALRLTDAEAHAFANGAHPTRSQAEIDALRCASTRTAEGKRPVAALHPDGHVMGLLDAQRTQLRTLLVFN
ncbi:tRNA pseudouridine(55) synthase TruB [Schaalia suimastitidis]|uniref:tRNA pseudouridine(55) synthase TruB n=1 Tax=Schaalia suimastitidis TaxID=121163 RepID=UPI000425D18F|nr:tRNA pseudouridine(55) synthase TruB [Schaalia suimastitidis]